MDNPTIPSLKLCIMYMEANKKMLSESLQEKTEEKNKLKQSFLCLQIMYEYNHYNIIFKKLNNILFKNHLGKDFTKNLCQLFENNSNEDKKDLDSNLQAHVIKLKDSFNEINKAFDDCQKFKKELIKFYETEDESLILNFESNYSSHSQVMSMLRTIVDDIVYDSL